MRTPGSALLVLAIASLPCLAAPAAAAAQAPAKAQDPVAGPSWPQEVTAGGTTYQVFQPRLTGLDASRAYLVTQVAMVGPDGKARVGQAQLTAEAMAADSPRRPTRPRSRRCRTRSTSRR
jgi:hypothetical protein